MTNWGNNYTRQNNQKSSKTKMRKYIGDLEEEYKRLKDQYEPNTNQLELKGQKLINNLVDSYK